MDKYDLIILIARSNGGHIAGRTVVQKLAYFANLRLGVDGIKYRDYFYGPFSRGVAIALEDLTSSLFIRETIRLTPIEQYSYELTADGSDLADRAAMAHPHESAEIGRIVAVCKKHCELQARPLSCAAKVHYMVQDTEGQQNSHADIQKMAQEFGWHMTDQEIERGITLLQEFKQEQAVV